MDAFNLLQTPWIPVKRRSGQQQRIAPHALTERLEDDPVVALDTTRPDFDGTLAQFLIGLLQTACAPPDEDGWLDWWDAAPPPDRLRQAFSAHEAYFNLLGDGARFLQESGLPGKEAVPIGNLLIDAPTGQTLRNNMDVFVKRGGVEGLCLPCAALALLTLQTNAPAGGAGNRTSLRGGGPLTTLLQGAHSLWETIWLNVLPAPLLLSRYPDAPAGDDKIFPWLAPTRVSNADGPGETTPADAHPLQMYWGMPRRILLGEPVDTGQPCGICGGAGPQIADYTTRPHGVQYEGPWEHPLSPHYFEKEGAPPSPRHPQPGGITYRYWVGLVEPTQDALRRPAAVVTYFNQVRCHGLHPTGPVMPQRLWAFGYDMDNMKARCWYDAALPLLHLPDSPEGLLALQADIQACVSAVETVAQNVRNCLKQAWFRRPGDVRGDMGFVDAAFWLGTESSFYRTLAALRTSVAAGEETLAVREAWHQLLCREAERLFAVYAESSPAELVDPHRLADARINLGNWNHGPKIREKILRLPKRAKAQDRRQET